jgi:hypothetical protein
MAAVGIARRLGDELRPALGAAEVKESACVLDVVLGLRGHVHAADRVLQTFGPLQCARVVVGVLAVFVV